VTVLSIKLRYLSFDSVHRGSRSCAMGHNDEMTWLQSIVSVLRSGARLSAAQHKFILGRAWRLVIRLFDRINHSRFGICSEAPVTCQRSGQTGKLPLRGKSRRSCHMRETLAELAF